VQSGAFNAAAFSTSARALLCVDLSPLYLLSLVSVVVAAAGGIYGRRPRRRCRCGDHRLGTKLSLLIFSSRNRCLRRPCPCGIDLFSRSVTRQPENYIVEPQPMLLDVTATRSACPLPELQELVRVLTWR
jgi:hypothetical protein